MLKAPIGFVGHIVFACPERHNVLDLQAWQALPAVVEQLSGMADMRLIILRGAGDKAFVAGADIAQFEDAFNGPKAAAMMRQPSMALRRWRNAPCRHWPPFKAIVLAAAWDWRWLVT